MRRFNKSDIELNRLIREAERLFVSDGTLTIALQRIDNALRVDPLSAEALVVKGRILVQLDRSRDALSCFDEANSIDPTYSSAFLERARILYALRHENKQALEEVRKALKHAGRDSCLKADALSLQGHILSDLENDDAAITSYRTALKLNPNDIDTRRALGVSLSNAGQPEKALKHFDRVLRSLNTQIKPNQLDMGFTRAGKAEALNALGRHFEALRVIEMGLKQIRNKICREDLQMLREQTRRLLREESEKRRK